jgi:membrane-bound serine protease (ClpP class)
MLKILIILVIVLVAFEIIEHLVFPLFWLIIIRRKKSMSGRAGMIGEIGQVREWNKMEGKIFVHGELWNATSDTPLAIGDKVTIQSVEGLTLKVKPISD